MRPISQDPSSERARALDGRVARGPHATRRLLLVAALSLAPSKVGHAGQDPLDGLLADEGALNNDCFVLVDEAAAESMRRGDEHWGAPELELAARRRVDAFEAWRRALTESAPGDAVPYVSNGPGTTLAADPDLPSAERRTEGVERAVLRRLAALDQDSRAQWSARFGDVADEALDVAMRASDPAALAQVERQNPATAAAARAALMLADMALEEGRIARALRWMERAREQVELRSGGEADTLEEAIAQRERYLDELDGGAHTPEVWERLGALEPIARLSLAPPIGRSRGGPPLGEGLRPGLVFLDDGRIAVQDAEQVFLIDAAGERREQSFEPARLMPGALPAPTSARLRTWRSAPGCPLLPATDGRDLVLVQGRLGPRQASPNAVLCVRPPRADVPSTEGATSLAELRWAIAGDHWWSPDGKLTRPELLAPLAEAEIQPGPLVVGDLVLVQVRFYQAEVDAYVLALDLATGEPRWLRYLARGRELQPGAVRFSSSSDPLASAQPLAVVSGRVFAGTHLGLGVLLDAVDGRWLWSVTNRRPDDPQAGWSGERPLSFDGDAGPELLWAPADSDRLYRLRASPLGPGQGPFLAPPSAQGRASVLLGGDAEETLVLARRGRHGTLSAWRRESGARLDSIYLGAAEQFAGPGLSSEARALFSTDSGLYVLDRERELYLAVDQRPLASDVGAPGGSVHARGALVAVLGRHELWTFRAQ